MSVDGYISGPGDAMDWVFAHSGPNPVVDAVIANTGAILAGRRSYNVGDDPSNHPGTQEVFEGAWSGPQFVLSHSGPTHPDPRNTFLNCSIAEAVGTALQAAGDKDLVLIGANIATQALDAGLVDELVLHVVPVILGSGTRLCDRVGPLVELTHLETTVAGTTTNLRYMTHKVMELEG